jgi:hypothetical protein
MRAPAFEHAAALIQIVRPIINAADTTLVTTDMAENRLDHVRRDVEPIMQGGRNAAAKIVQRPILQRLAMVRLRNARIELSLALRPPLKSPLDPSAENMIPRRTIGGAAVRLCFQNRERRLREWNQMFATVFGARRCERDGGVFEVDLTPAQATNLVATRPRQQEQFKNCTVLVVIEGQPDGAQVGIGGNVLPRPVLDGPICEADRISVDIAFARQSCEIRRQRRSRSIGGCGAAGRLDLGQPCRNGSPDDVLHWKPVERLGVD